MSFLMVPNGMAEDCEVLFGIQGQTDDEFAPAIRAAASCQYAAALQFDEAFDYGETDPEPTLRQVQLLLDLRVRVENLEQHV
jgi:hypothetical protein